MMTLAAAARALGARVVGPDAAFTSVSTDTRTIAPGALFVALRGERFDGHDYLDAAGSRGAVAAMVERVGGVTGRGGQLPLLVVGDTRLSLGALAKHWRLRHALPVIAVTGSNGKTTVKEMIAECLRAHFGADRVLATAGNLNNDIGLPLTLLGLREGHACAVVELGMNHPGETAYLADLARPTVAVVNNAQREHQEFMKSVADVAAEHSAVFAALPPDGVAVVNEDDAYAAYWKGVAGTRPVRGFGLSQGAVTATCTVGALESDVEIAAPEGRARFTLHVPGVHNVRNALAAVAAASAVGVPVATAARALEGFRAVKGRMQAKAGRHGARVIDDTYNANPDSVLAAIDVLAAAPAPRALVLGDMGEVGSDGPAFHEEIGRHARRQGIERVLAVGPLAREAARAFGAGAEHFDSVEALIARLQGLMAARPTVLVKGSRFMRMERVVEHVVEGEGR
jgi:UDP-N-acetylmuramoyl-tripeptide--D-alanyl-D-alanine ligase